MIITPEQIDKLLTRVRRPSRYIDGEVGAVNKPWDKTKVKWCLVFPDTYEIGMSNVGLSILYDILNSQEGIFADRAFAPWVDMEQAMREDGVPLWGLTSRRSLDEFDIIGITLPYELVATNILNILDLGGIPLLASERGNRHPIIIGGGAGAFNPGPLEDFFDAFFLGDGEEAVLEISKVTPLRNIPGIYVPGGTAPVRRSVVGDLNASQFPTRPIVPYMRVVHDRVGVEIQRGCVHGCRFCQAGFLYRPMRQRAPLTIERLAAEGARNTGHEEISFLSLSAGDHACLPDIIRDTAEELSSMWVNITLPSLRVETLTPEAINVLKRSLHGGFTLAPEAGTERLRRVINKGNTEEDLLATIDRVFATGWRLLKLYFMIGLPTETDDDVRAIADLAHKALNIGRRYRRDITITVSASTFVPKAHTPFQWARQISMDETVRRQKILMDSIRGRNFELKWHSARTSFLEGVFARGDKKLSKILLEAWRSGARFDAWDETFKFDAWMEAFKKCGIDPDEYLRERGLDECLPWNHLFAELDKDFLKKEYTRGLNAEPTPDCLSGPCTGCGVCEGGVPNVTPAEAGAQTVLKKMDSDFRRNDGFCIKDNKFNFILSKTGRAKWLSHLELMQVLRRALRRAGLRVAYSQGFHPHMKLSVAPALKVGEEGASLSLNVTSCVAIEPGDFAARLNKELPEGVLVGVG